MIAKVRCQNCGQLHDVEMDINLDYIGGMSERSEWMQGIFKAIVFNNIKKVEDDNEPTVNDAKNAMRELERDFLNKIVQFENRFGIAIQYIETNISDIPRRERNDRDRTNSVLIYGDL